MTGYGPQQVLLENFKYTTSTTTAERFAITLAVQTDPGYVTILADFQTAWCPWVNLNNFPSHSYPLIDSRHECSSNYAATLRWHPSSFSLIPPALKPTPSKASWLPHRADISGATGHLYLGPPGLRPKSQSATEECLNHLYMFWLKQKVHALPTITPQFLNQKIFLFRFTK